MNQKNNKQLRTRKLQRRRHLHRGLSLVALFIMLESAMAFTPPPKGKAIGKALGTTKGVKKFSGAKGVFYSTASQSLAILEDGIYPPNCTHLWAIGYSCKSNRITEVVPMEGSCPHAFPAFKNSFTAQYKGVKATEAKSLKGKIQTVAKATGTSDLTTEAVVKTIRKAVKICKKAF